MRVRSFGIFTLMVMQSLLELFFILSLANMGAALTDPESVRNTFLYKGLFFLFPILESFSADPKQLLLLVGGVVVVFSILKNFINFLTARSVAYLGEDISLDIGHEIMSRYLYQNYAWHLSPESNSMYQRMAWRQNLGTMLTHLLTLYATVLTIFILFFSLLGNEPMLTTLVVAFTSAVGVILFRTIRKNVDASAQKSAQSVQEETKALLCVTKGIREILIYRQQETFLQALVNAALKGRKPRAFTETASALPVWVLEAVGFCMVVVAIAFLVYIENAGIARISAALALLVLTAWRVLPYCNRVVSLQISIRSLRHRATAVIELLEQLRALPSDPPPLPAHDFSFDREIRLENIHFRYANANEDSLCDISFTIQKGEKIGLIGKSGGGKTTLAGVLCGLLPPTNGTITIDGLPLDEGRRAAFATHIGYVPQTPFLFAGSLADNIAFSDWGKEWNEEHLLQACKQASIDFIDNHRDGILRPIGDNGSGLSGGQAQRVSIARAMYTDPSLLIFDEATSALDQHNENAIQETIEKLSHKVTSIIIAHRLSTVQHCDRILWVDQGRIVMDGKAKDVIEKYSLSRKN